MSLSSRRDKLVGFHKRPLPTSPSVDDDASFCVQSLLPSDSSGRRYDLVEPSSADSDVCWELS